ncbi:c-type cytochrome [Albidovulum sediminicola]|uniref:Cytochrome c n=1 Tax=Albidovulum sediminicola TaxID=2984331 RepID=A0ABT2Z3N5_9RHOB|nr:cytochrome c [Defluviimonas sp. WL0075]MCV2865706.1 cytochrome c [Defluviimonas sp. WL0075]
MKKVIAGMMIAAALGTGAAFADDEPFEMQIDARQGIMDYRALQMGVLGGMVKGEVEYDAAAAQKAADALLAASTLDASMLWPAGSDSDAVMETAALPAIWAEGSDIGAKGKAMAEAAAALQAAAGGGLDALKAAFGPVGAACGDCHKTYRKSDG